MTWLLDLYDRAHEHWSHTFTVGLGLGWFISAVELTTKLLGLAVLAAGLYFSYAKDRRDRELHEARLRGEQPPMKVFP
jgi:hypothetical protein